MAVQAFDQATSEVREAKGATPKAVHLPLKRGVTPTIKRATAADEAAVIDVVTLAFSADPLLRWVYPDPHQYLTYAPEVARAFAGKAFAHATAYYVDGYLGAALWLPPEVHPDEDELISLLQDSVSQPSKQISLDSWNRWAATIRESHIGICHSSGSIRSITARAMAPR